jgi:hypothetical protein
MAILSIGMGKWPTVDMTPDAEPGIWAYTLPLPNGTWVYRFYVGGVENAELTDRPDAEQVWDPTNPPLLYDYEATDMPPKSLSRPTGPIRIGISRSFFPISWTAFCPKWKPTTT